jgi:hypothetical protein
MNAVKHNFLLKGYFKKKARVAEEKKSNAAEQKAAEKKK